MDEVVRALDADRRQRREAHEQRPVAVGNDHPSVRSCDGDAERKAAGAAHRADHVEVVLAVAECIQCAAAVAGGRDDHVLAAAGVDQHLQRRVGVESLVRGKGAVDAGVHDALRRARQVPADRLDRALLQDQRVRPPFLLHVGPRPLQRRSERVRIGGKQLPRHLHRLEHRRRDRAHEIVLWLIVGAARLAAPRGEHQNG